MAIKRHPVLLAVYLVLFKNRKVLLLRRFNTGYEDGNYSLIAGHVEKNETVSGATICETAEETGIIVNPKDLKFLHVMNRLSETERIDCFFGTKKWQGEPINNKTAFCIDMQWCEVNSLPSGTIPNIKAALKFISNNTYFSEFGWEKRQS
ncbi:MAG: NUDIX hydrolase [Patescibacteria group bacterium]|jgi:8-oxo-dGTP diphosphatase